MQTTRRDFLAMTGIAAGSLVSPLVESSSIPASMIKKDSDRLKLGMASYTLRKFNLDDTIAMTKRIGLDYIAFKRYYFMHNEDPDRERPFLDRLDGAFSPGGR